MIPTAYEKGKAQPVARPVDRKDMPRGDGVWPVAPVAQFQAIYNSATRLYYSWFDEALRDNISNAYRMKLDPMISTCLEVRAGPTALLTGSVEPQDDDDPAQLAAAKRVTKDVLALSGRAPMNRALLTNGIFTGVSGSQVLYRWFPVNGALRMRPAAWSHVDGDSIAVGWDGQPAIRVQAGMFDNPRIVNTEWGQAYKLTPEDRECFLLFRHNPQAAEYWRPQAARSTVGSGLRNSLYWLWALKSQLWQMSLDYLAWFARGMTFLYYEYGNDAHRQKIRDDMKAQDGSFARMYPVFRDGPDGKPYFQKPFDHIQPGTANASFLQDLASRYVDDMIRFVILHQSLTTSTEATGMGSGVAAAHQSTFENIVKMDSLQLDACYTDDLVSVLYRVNEPGVPPGRWVSQVDSPNVDQILETAQAIVALGGSVPEKYIKDAAGVPASKPGETVLGGLQQGQPAAVGQIPDGMPMVGADPSGLQPLQ